MPDYQDRFACREKIPKKFTEINANDSPANESFPPLQTWSDVSMKTETVRSTRKTATSVRRVDSRNVFRRVSDDRRVIIFQALFANLIVSLPLCRLQA